MPRPTPPKIRPPAKPRRAGGTCGRTVAATRTMVAPPDTPARKRQKKNQATDSGKAQAKKASDAAAVSNRSTVRLESARAIERPVSAPTR